MALGAVGARPHHHYEIRLPAWSGICWGLPGCRLGPVTAGPFRHPWAVRIAAVASRGTGTRSPHHARRKLHSAGRLALRSTRCRCGLLGRAVPTLILIPAPRGRGALRLAPCFSLARARRLWQVAFRSHGLRAATQLRTYFGALGRGRPTWDKGPCRPSQIIAIALLAAPSIAREAQRPGARRSLRGHLAPPALKAIVILYRAAATGARRCVGTASAPSAIVVPHLLHLLIGPDHRNLLRLQRLLGGGTARACRFGQPHTSYAPAELPIGIVTAAVARPSSWDPPAVGRGHSRSVRPR